MKVILNIVLFSMIISSAYAAKVEDVSVLDLKYVKGNFEAKLQSKEAGKDSYFLVTIVKEDEKAFEKLSLILKKIKKKDSFKLNLDIPSFSPFPNGSLYRSKDIKFSGNAEGESLL